MKLHCNELHVSLLFQRGEVVRIIRKTADGWWLAQDTKGNKGVVPKTYLKVHNQPNIWITVKSFEQQRNFSTTYHKITVDMKIQFTMVYIDYSSNKTCTYWSLPCFHTDLSLCNMLPKYTRKCKHTIKVPVLLLQYCVSHCSVTNWWNWLWKTFIFQIGSGVNDEDNDEDEDDDDDENEEESEEDDEELTEQEKQRFYITV